MKDSLLATRDVKDDIKNLRSTDHAKLDLKEAQNMPHKNTLESP